MRVKNAMNNIHVRYMGREISIAQHVHSGHTIVQEIQDEIERDIWGDKPSGESTATAAQSTTGSAA